MLEDLHQMCTGVTCMDGTRRVDRMVYRYPNREGGSLCHEEYLITTQDEVNVMLEFLKFNNLSKAEMFVYTDEVEGVGGHSGEGQTSGIHGGGELYGDHPYQSYHDPRSYFHYQEQGEGHHQSFPSYEEEVQRDHANQPDYNFHSRSDSFHNYHYGADEGTFHEVDQMEDALPAPVSDPSDEEKGSNVSADSSDPLEGADDSGPKSDSADGEASRDRVPISYYNHIPDDNWCVDTDMEPLEVPVWGPLTGFMKSQQFGSKKEVRHAIETEAMTRHFEWHTTHSNTKSS
ncbi:unnamed protein product [Linum trigynum]|uniref:Uncharacterized protein n=1 Tax=Linum trigynum TaxID=586398 RepID=A0AAV2DSH9_9ROSI